MLCNLASQQPLMRLLDGLTAVTGKDKYRATAEEATRYTMQHLRTPNGLLHWGGHMAWDLAADKPVGQYGLVHELKGQQPYYALMHRVAPAATRQQQETIWATHVLDWPLLDYNRHANGAQELRRKHDRARDALGHVHTSINEAKIVASYHRTGRYHTLPLAQMQAGEELLAAGDAFAAVGRELIDGAVDDLKIYARECFDQQTGQFKAMTTDGEELRWREAKTDY